MASEPVRSTAVAAAPKDYSVAANQQIRLLSVTANFTDNGATGSWLPAVIIEDNNGNALVRAVDQGVKVTAGNDAEVSWFPGVKPSSVSTFTIIGSGPAPIPVTNPLAITLGIKALQADTANFGAGVGHFGLRIIAPQTGFLRDLSVYVGSLVGGDQAEVAILDTTTPNRSVLYKSGYVNLATAQAWNTVGNPGLLVTAGQHFDLVCALSQLTTVLWVGGLENSVANATASQLPTNYLPVTGGAKPILAWFDNTSAVPYGVTTSVPETRLSPQLGCPMVIGRIAAS